jgi:hypothetical protein
MKTLQQQYLLIKEGKGNKDHFLKQARNLFPEFITSGNDYNSATQILKGKGILSEAVGGVIGINPNSKPDWFKIFDTNLREAVGVKNTKEYGDQNEFEKIDKEVQDALDHNFDNKDEKNIDNVYGQSFLMGYYTEMKDPKNADKTVDELKQIVLKNMVKDVTYYNTKTSFGVKDIGYTKDVVGGGDPVAPKGKYKSSGYGDMPKTKVIKENLENKYSEYSNDALADMVVNLSRYEDTEDMIQMVKAELEKRKKSKNVKEGLNESYDDMYGVDGEDENEFLKDKYQNKNNDKIARYEKYTYTLDGEKVTPDDIAFYNNLLGAELDGKVYKMGIPDENGNVELRLAKGKTGMYTESLSEAKKSNVHTRIKDLEKQNEVLALESKITALEEAINELTQKVSLSESDDLAEMMDPKKINELKKDIKVLEKYKMTCEKKLSKLGGKKPVVDNENMDENMDMDENAMNEY